MNEIWKSHEHDGNRNFRAQAERSLHRLMVGEEGLHMDDNSLRGRRFQDEIRKALRTRMASPVQELLKDSIQENWGFPGSTKYCWKVTGRVKEDIDIPAIDSMRSQLVARYNDSSVCPVDFDLYKKARFVETNTVGEERCYAHNVLEVNAAVSAVVQEIDDGLFVETIEDGSGTLKYFVVCGIISLVGRRDVWVFVKEMSWKEDEGGFNCKESSIRLLKLQKTNGRVGLIQICGEECKSRSRGVRMQHVTTPLQGGTYQIVGHQDGYPPFLG